MTEEMDATGATDAISAELRRLGAVRAPRDLTARVLAALEPHRFALIDSELGPLAVAFTPSAITAVRGSWEEPPFQEWYRQTYGHEVLPAGELPVRVRGRYDLDQVGPFQRAVLRKALEIPRGQVRPYSWIAAEIGHPKAVRAVGTALATNPIPYFIPCHRVVRSDGLIGNYGLGGPDFKRRILRAEGAEPDDLERLARQGRRYTGSDLTRVYCFPTCGHARRITDRHRVWFHDAADAQTNGYRPCQVCRPLAGAA